MIKVQKVKEILGGIGSAVLAYSGGVDSALLARLARDAIGDKLLLVTAVSDTFTDSELERAKSFAARLGVEHLVVNSKEMDDPRFLENGPGKCYYCKSVRYAELDRIRGERGYKALLDGTNADDAGDYRPGSRASKKFGVRQPFLEAGVTKEEIRAAAKSMDLPMWDAPSQACLASRVQYGVPISRELLERVKAAEDLVREITGSGEIRVRHHGDLARIELPPSFIEPMSAADVRGGLVEALERLGYKYVTIDLKGYRTGSMNEGLSEGGPAPGEKR